MRDPKQKILVQTCFKPNLVLFHFWGGLQVATSIKHPGKCINTQTLPDKSICSFKFSLNCRLGHLTNLVK